jgi:hypothetical protein
MTRVVNTNDEKDHNPSTITELVGSNNIDHRSNELIKFAISRILV